MIPSFKRRRSVIDADGSAREDASQQTSRFLASE